MVGEFRRGAGAGFAAFGLHDIQAAFNRPAFVHHLTQRWLPALPAVQARLTAGDPVRIAELGCGEGFAAITIAQAYPNAVIDGYDLDEPSVAAARLAAQAAGVADRARFEVRDAADPSLAGRYDLVMAIEMLHDVPDPVAVLRAMRSLAATDGTVLVIDERTEDMFTAPAGEMERVFYAFSTLHCLAVGMQHHGAATGTVMRLDTLRRYAHDAGFSTVDVLDVQHPQFRLTILA